MAETVRVADFFGGSYRYKQNATNKPLSERQRLAYNQLKMFRNQNDESNDYQQYLAYKALVDIQKHSVDRVEMAAEIQSGSKWVLSLALVEMGPATCQSLVYSLARRCLAIDGIKNVCSIVLSFYDKLTHEKHVDGHCLLIVDGMMLDPFFRIAAKIYEKDESLPDENTLVNLIMPHFFSDCGATEYLANVHEISIDSEIVRIGAMVIRHEKLIEEFEEILDEQISNCKTLLAKERYYLHKEELTNLVEQVKEGNKNALFDLLKHLFIERNAYPISFFIEECKQMPDIRAVNIFPFIDACITDQFSLALRQICAAQLPTILKDPLISFLVQQGKADVNEIPASGLGAIHYAMINQDPHIIQKLIENGAEDIPFPKTHRHFPGKLPSEINPALFEQKPTSSTPTASNDVRDDAIKQLEETLKKFKEERFFEDPLNNGYAEMFRVQLEACDFLPPGQPLTHDSIDRIIATINRSTKPVKLKK